jgi:hypothetical protein
MGLLLLPVSLPLLCRPLVAYNGLAALLMQGSLGYCSRTLAVLLNSNLLLKGSAEVLLL